MCAGKPSRFSCAISISPPQRPLLPWQKGRAPKEGDRLCLSPSFGRWLRFEYFRFVPGQKPTANPAKRIAVGKEEQRNECDLTFEKKSEQAICSLLRRGAGGGTRTHTESPPADFESATSTIPSHRHLLNHDTMPAAGMQGEIPRPREAGCRPRGAGAAVSVYRDGQGDFPKKTGRKSERSATKTEEEVV